MLLNNFKPLLMFGNNGRFKDVTGADVPISNLVHHLWAQDNINGHSTAGCARSFDYAVTTGGNSYIDEQTVYRWTGLSSGIGFESSRGMHNMANGFTLFTGTGNTPVTSEDYKLENAVPLNVTAGSCTHGANGKVIVLRIFQNNTGADVTIKELGCYLFASKSQNCVPIVMIGRKVLNAPVIIPDGEQYAFTYTIDMNNVSFGEADK